MTDDETLNAIVELRDIGWTREEIAADLGIDFSEVRNLIRKHRIGKGIRVTTKIGFSQGDPVPMKYNKSVLEQAKEILGDTLIEKPEGYFIGRTPVNTKAIIEAAGLVFDDDNA